MPAGAHRTNLSRYSQSSRKFVPPNLRCLARPRSLGAECKPFVSRPFLVKLSTDKWDSLLCARNIVLQTPHRFETTVRRSSMADFRRASLEFAKLAKVFAQFQPTNNRHQLCCFQSLGGHRLHLSQYMFIEPDLVALFISRFAGKEHSIDIRSASSFGICRG